MRFASGAFMLRPMRASAHDRITLTTREKTPDGFLRGKATVTKVGVLEYDAAELGVGEPGNIVRVRQTPDSVFHPDTLRSVQNAAVTIGHPEGGVTPESWRAHAVGSVGSPQRMGDAHVGADILFGARQAVDTVEVAGWEELSIGKRFTIEEADGDADADYVTVGPIDVNHVAVVEKGRAGPDVRVLDTAKEEDHMTPEQQAAMQTAITKAVTDALPGNSSQQSVDVGAIARAVSDAVQPALDSVTKVQQDAETARQREAADKAKADLKVAFDKAVEDARKEGYAAGQADGQMRTDALACITDATVAAQMATEADVHKILIAAAADVAPNAAALPKDALHGIVMAKKAMIANSTPPQGGGHTPFGTQPWNGGAGAHVGMDQARTQRRKEYHDAVDHAFRTGNVVQPGALTQAVQ